MVKSNEWRWRKILKIVKKKKVDVNPHNFILWSIGQFCDVPEVFIYTEYLQRPFLFPASLWVTVYGNFIYIWKLSEYLLNAHTTSLWGSNCNIWETKDKRDVMNHQISSIKVRTKVYLCVTTLQPELPGATCQTTQTYRHSQTYRDFWCSVAFYS